MLMKGILTPRLPCERCGFTGGKGRGVNAGRGLGGREVQEESGRIGASREASGKAIVGYL